MTSEQSTSAVLSLARLAASPLPPSLRRLPQDKISFIVANRSRAAPVYLFGGRSMAHEVSRLRVDVVRVVLKSEERETTIDKPSLKCVIPFFLGGLLKVNSDLEDLT